MTVTAPPRPPAPPRPDAPDDLEALIEEARRRARRRRLRNAAVALTIGGIVLGALGAGHLSGGGHHPSAAATPSRPPRPTPLPARALPANGHIAVVQDSVLATMAPDGSRWRRLASCPPYASYCDCWFGNLAWSPNGSFLVFLAGHLGGAGPSDLALWIVRADGAGPLELARCGNCNDQQPLAWSPDSRRVAFVADTGLYVVDVVSGTRHRLDAAPTSTGPRPATTVAWSPDGSRIAFGSGDALYSVKPDGSGLARVVGDLMGVANPAWSPDGTEIAFDTGDSVYIVDADGSHLRLLLGGSLGSGPGVPTWSPNGRRILYFSTPGSPNHFTGEVWSMKPDGSDRRRLYRAPCCVGLWHPPVWSPDGRWIAFSGASDRSGVVVMDARGRHRRKLLDISSVTAWQPLPRPR